VEPLVGPCEGNGPLTAGGSRVTADPLFDALILEAQGEEEGEWYSDDDETPFYFHLTEEGGGEGEVGEGLDESSMPYTCQDKGSKRRLTKGGSQEEEEEG
jgi:hypothetical protein